MSTQEFYIRGESDVEARGPFTQDQLASLVEAGQVTQETLYYDAAIEQWVTIGSNASLVAFLFPEKRRLRVKPKDEIPTINVQSESDAPIRVEDMLAAAEGRTAETAGKGDPKITLERVAAAGRYALIVMFLLSVFSFLLPRLEPIYAGEWKKVIIDPYALFGLLDVFLAIVLLLGATSFYPFVRFRALLGIGFFGGLLFLTGQALPLLAIGAGLAGMYLCTIAIRWSVLLVSAGIGLAGMAALAYLSVFA